MKKKTWIWIVLGAVVVVGLISVGVAKNAKGQVTAVTMARVRRDDITSRVRAPGKIGPRKQVKVSADFMGKIVHLLVKDGDRGRRGWLFLQLDDSQDRAADQQPPTA